MMLTLNKVFSTHTSIKRTFLVAAIYFVLGVVGLSFAIPPGYASPIFPAAGFAVAVMLWSANRVWSGIWLGSLMLNLGVSLFNGELNLNSIALVFTLATGATLQAFIASCLVSWAVGKAWQDMELESDIVLCLLLAGGLACVVSATVGVSALYYSGVITTAVYENTWWNWWVGDTLGVLIVMPIVLSILYRNHVSWRHRIKTVFSSMLAVLLVVACLVGLSSYWEQNLRKIEIKKQGENFQQLIQQRYIAHREAIAALSRLIEVIPNMTYDQFEHFTRITLNDNPDIFALSFNPYIRSHVRAQFEQDMTKLGTGQSFYIKDRDNHGNLVIAGERDVYVPVTFIAPLQANVDVIGFDLYSNSQRREAIDYAIASGDTVLTSPMNLAQEKDNSLGLLLMYPALNARINDAHIQDHNNFIGFAVAVLKVDEMIRIATAPLVNNGLIYRIDDAGAPLGRRVVFRSDKSHKIINENYLWRSSIQIANRTWDLTAFPSNEYLHKQPTPMTWVVSLIGLFFTAILQVLMLVVTGRNGVVERKVREQTQELQAKSDALLDSNAQLNAMFALSPDGFVAISAQGIVQFSNPAFQEITGISNQRIILQNISVLDDELRKRAQHSEQFNGIFSYFILDKNLPMQHELILQRPNKVVLQMIGMHSDTFNVAHILYLRDVTSEYEVANMKTEFISHAAHELRTPMTSIFGYIELMLARRFDEKTQREMLEAMQRQSKLMVSMINELLDLARIDAKGDKDFNLAKLEMNVLVTKIVADLTLEKASRNIVLQRLDDDCWIEGDAVKIGQAIMNVFINAEKYSSPGQEIKLNVIKRGNHVGVQITDQGIGMTDTQIAHVGERFWRADHSGSRPGTGLGMSIVKEIMQFHGGHVDIESKLDHGTTVTLWFSGTDPI
jgi:signal transduction histidine kinase/integral membrane sensor domain MASE1